MPETPLPLLEQRLAVLEATHRWQHAPLRRLALAAVLYLTGWLTLNLLLLPLAPVIALAPVVGYALGLLVLAQLRPLVTESRPPLSTFPDKQRRHQRQRRRLHPAERSY